MGFILFYMAIEATLGEWTHPSLTITIQCVCESMCVHV